MSAHKLPHCPKCLRPTVTLSGNYANCRNRECVWQGRAVNVIEMWVFRPKVRKHDDVHTAISA